MCLQKYEIEENWPQITGKVVVQPTAACLLMQYHQIMAVLWLYSQNMKHIKGSRRTEMTNDDFFFVEVITNDKLLQKS